jgi:hypothetical protein
MRTMKQLCDDTRRLAFGGMGEQINLLAADAPYGADRLTFEMDVSPVQPGMILSSGLNVWYVREVVQASKTVFVVPGFDGSVSATAAAGDVVFLKPRVTDWLLFNMLNDVIRSLSAPTNGLYRQGSWTVPVSPAWQTYEVPPDVSIMSMIGAQIRFPGSADSWIDVSPNSIQWQPENGTIRLTRDFTAGTDIRFHYRGEFTPALNLAWDVVSMCGLSLSMVDIPPLGAAVNLLRTTESRRSQIGPQGDPRRATEVTGGQNSSAAREMERAFRSRVADEYGRLVNLNPITQSV